MGESQSVSLVPLEKWAGFSARVVRRTCWNTAGHSRKELQDIFDSVPALIGSDPQKVWDISLNFSDGTSQYMTCIKFAAKKKHNGDVVLAESLFGKKWVEQSDYHRNRAFWES